jgi:hypothetical protein
MNPISAALLAIAISFGVLFYISERDSARIDSYVKDCRSHGGWAARMYWPDHSGWIQCIKVEAISLDQHLGAKP